MTLNFYNDLQTLYVALSKYPTYNDFIYKQNYKCFNHNYFFVRGERTEFLEKLSNISINEVYSEAYVIEMGFPDTYLNKKLVNFDENRVCIIDGLGPIVYYYILYNLRAELNGFIYELELAKRDLKAYAKVEDIYLKFHHVEFFEHWIKRFDRNENMKMLIHLFTKTKSNVITLDINGAIEINEKKIKGYFKTLEHFDFLKLAT